MKTFNAGPVRVLAGTRAELSEEARDAALLLLRSAAGLEAVRGPVQAFTAAVDRLTSNAPHAAAGDHLFIPDQNGATMTTPEDIGPHCCRARDLPPGVYILDGSYADGLCLVVTSPVTQDDGKTRFMLDCGGRTERAEYPAGRLVHYWRTARPDDLEDE